MRQVTVTTRAVAARSTVDIAEGAARSGGGRLHIQADGSEGLVWLARVGEGLGGVMEAKGRCVDVAEDEGGYESNEGEGGAIGSL